MNFWEKITGSDMTKKMKVFEQRVKKLPPDYQTAWEEIEQNLWSYTDITGRNLMPVFDDVIGLLEETAAEGRSAKDVLGDDIKEFCRSLAEGEGVVSYHDKWRAQLNNTIAQKLANKEKE